MKTILITGATGFVGSCLLKKITKDSNYKVIVLKRSFSNTKNIEKLISNSRIKYYNIDKVNLEDVFIENEVNLIVHCATEYGREKKSINKVFETNLMFPIELLNVAIKYKVKYFINTDSYFNKKNTPYSFLLNYSLSKKSLLLWLKYFSKQISIVNVILEHVYGEYDSYSKFVEFAIQNIAIKQIKSINLTSGCQKRDFIYIDDVCNTFLSIIKYVNTNSFTFKQFNIGTGKTLSIYEFVMLIKKISKSKTRLNFGALEYRDNEIMYSCGDKNDLKVLHLNKFRTPNEGLKNIIKIYQNNLKDKKDKSSGLKI
jgi:nucleoside-diphosphate-sugar epimerase